MAWFFLMLPNCFVLFANCGLVARSFLGRRKGTVYAPPEQRPLTMTTIITTYPWPGKRRRCHGPSRQSRWLPRLC